MTFDETLNQYIRRLSCSTKELSIAAGLSASAISRYRSGGRRPGANSKQLHSLANGIAKIASAKSIPDISYDSVMADFKDSLGSGQDMQAFASNFDFILTELNINVSSISTALNYDASFLSRIRHGSRMPSDLPHFTHKLALYIVRNYSADDIANMLNRHTQIQCSPSMERDALIHCLEQFLIGTETNLPDYTADFLHKLDAFNLNEYIRSIHFDDLKVPTAPFQFQKTKYYNGVKGQQQGELDFIRGSVLSKSSAPVFMYSDMDMADMADTAFSKNWMLGLAMLLKKETPIHIIHNLNRPFHELMLGLEAWIPLYMTGLVTPYYLSGIQSNVFQHLLYVSGAFALSGEGVKGYHEDGRYFLTNDREHVKYYKKRAHNLTKRAHSLMDIYTADDYDQFLNFYRTAVREPGERHYLYSSLPAFTLPDDTLAGILAENGLDEDAIQSLCRKVRERKASLKHILDENRLVLEIPDIPEEEFASHPLILNLSDYGYVTPVSYRYADYRAHMQTTLDAASLHPNFIVKPCKNFAFRNIYIRILEGQWVWISKATYPPIHFVIRYPGLREAIERMYIPIYD